MKIFNRTFKVKPWSEIKTGLLIVLVSIIIYVAISGASSGLLLNGPIFKSAFLEFVFTWICRAFLVWFFVVDIVFRITKNDKE